MAACRIGSPGAPLSDQYVAAPAAPALSPLPLGPQLPHAASAAAAPAPAPRPRNLRRLIVTLSPHSRPAGSVRRVDGRRKPPSAGERSTRDVSVVLRSATDRGRRR